MADDKSREVEIRNPAYKGATPKMVGRALLKPSRAPEAKTAAATLTSSRADQKEDDA